MICGKRCCWLRTSFCWKKGGWRRAAGGKNCCGCGIRKSWRSRAFWMAPEAPRDGAMEFHGGAPVRNPECDGGACRTCVHRDGGRDFDWGAAGDADCAAGRTSSASAWDRRGFSDDTKFGAVWIFNSDSVYRRDLKGGGDCGGVALLAAGGFSGYICLVGRDAFP